MKISTLFIALILTVCSIAQTSSLTVFNNGGQPFFVIMNGIRQNSIPQTNVKIGGMVIGSYEVKLIFADGKTGDINKKIYLSEPGDYLSRVVFKGSKRKLQYFGMTSASNPAPAGGTSIIYRPNDQATYSDQVQITQPESIITPTTNYPSGTINGSTNNIGTSNGTTNGAVVNTNTNNTPVNGTSSSSTSTNGSTTTVQSTTTQTSTSGTVNPSNGMGGININVNVSDPATNGGTGSFGTTTTIKDPVTGEVINMGTSINGTSTTTTTTTTTTTNTTTTMNGGTSSVQGNGTSTIQQSHPTNAGSSTTTQPVYNQNAGSMYNCTSVLPSSEVFVAKLKAASFDKDRVEMIQSEMAQKCLNSQQAYGILNTLTFNTDRLEQAKFLYLRMTDKINGSILLELFSFDFDKEEFTEFMEKNK